MELPRSEMRVVEPRTMSDFGNEDAWAQDLDPWLRDGIPSIDVNDDQVKEEPTTFLKRNTATFPRLVTAAELARDQEATAQKRFHPEIFKVGMSVDHPDYGIGVIVDISGSGIKKTGTVDFREYGKRRFRLSHAPLAPAEE